MTDPTSTFSPIVVNANPATDQKAAALRQALLALGAICMAFGAAKATGFITILATEAGPIIVLIGFLGTVVAGASAWIGQLKTRSMAEKSAAMAAQLPDDIAVTK